MGTFVKSYWHPRNENTAEIKAVIESLADTSIETKFSDVNWIL